MGRQQIVIALTDGLDNKEIAQAYLTVKEATYEAIGDRVYNVFAQVEPPSEPWPLEPVEHQFHLHHDLQAYCTCSWLSSESALPEDWFEHSNPWVLRRLVEQWNAHVEDAD